MPRPLNITEFRQNSSACFTEAVHHHKPLVIQRGSADLGLLVGRDEAWTLVAQHDFHPEVLRGNGSVSIWLPEFELYGQGVLYQEAKQDLLADVRTYIEEYLENADRYLRDPNRAAQLPHVIKAHLADLAGKLESVLFPGPPPPSTTGEEPNAVGHLG
jgi:hypothetical protein